MKNEATKKQTRKLFVFIGIVVIFGLLAFSFTAIDFPSPVEAQIDKDEIVSLREQLSKAESEIEEWKTKDIIQTEQIESLSKLIVDNKSTMEQHIINVNRKVFPQLATIISNAIIEAEIKYPNIPYSIILAVVELESTFKYTAVSNKDCIGLMQINYKIWLDESNEFNLIKAGIVTKKDDLYDPTKNIQSGTYILNHYYDQIDSDDVKTKWEGALNKYFGDSSTDYFDKFQKFFGNFHLYASSKRKSEPVDEYIQMNE